VIETTLFDITRSWLIQATGLPDIIQAHESAPRPNTAHGVLNLLRSRQVTPVDDFVVEANSAYDEEAPGDEVPGWIGTVRGLGWTWSLNIYAQNAMDLANAIRPWKDTAEGQLLVFPLVIHNVSDPQRLPVLRENAWQVRVQMEIEMQAYVTTLRHNAPGSPGSATNPPAEQTLEFLGRVPQELADPITIDIFTDTDRNLQAGLVPVPLTPTALQAQLT